MDFKSGKELQELCEKKGQPIPEVLRQRELCGGALSPAQIEEKLDRVLEIMRASAHGPLTEPRRSMGGLIGGEAKLVHDHGASPANVTGGILSKAIAYSMGVLEVNASMGLIVAAPTAGSSGVVPGALLAVAEEKGLSDGTLKKGLLNAGAIGYLLMRNASVSGAEAGCQAEVGSASAMATSALVEMMGGTPGMCLHGAALALSNLLGLVCDPIAGLVEAPCQSRNTVGVANAVTCAELALSGVTSLIPFDEMAEAMYQVGTCLPAKLRETAMGGAAATPTGCALCRGGKQESDGIFAYVKRKAGEEP